MGARVFEAAEAIGEVGAVPQAVLDDVQMAACPLGRPLEQGGSPGTRLGWAARYMVRAEPRQVP